MRRWGISLTSVISRPWAEKCFRKSASEILGGKPLMNILDEAIMMLFFVVYISRSMANGFTVGVERVKSFSELGLFKKGERKKKFLYHILIARGWDPTLARAPDFLTVQPHHQLPRCFYIQLFFFTALSSVMGEIPVNKSNATINSMTGLKTVEDSCSRI